MTADKKTSLALKSRSVPRWLRVLIPIVLVLVWLGAAGFGGPYFGKISEVADNDPANFLPTSAESTLVDQELERFQDSSAIPLIAVFTSDSVLTEDEQQSVNRLVSTIEDEEIVVSSLAPAILSEDEQAQLVVVPLDSTVDYEASIEATRQLIDQSDVELQYALTGPAMFSRDLSEAFAGIDGTLLAVALAAVLVILLVVYRSPLLPIVTLSGSLIALAVSVLVVWHLADAEVVRINGQVQGILFILVIGAATDYSLLYIARYREELVRYQSAWEATKRAWRVSVEPIVAAGGTVILGLLCLLASDLGSNKDLGPVGSIGIVFAILTTLTFLPAALLLLGRTAFWPRSPRYSKNNQPESAQNHAFWSRVAYMVGRHPRRVWVGVAAILLVASLALPQFRADGVSQTDLILGESEARDGQTLLETHFPKGAGTPLYILTPVAEVSDVVSLLDDDAAVDAVSVLSSDKDRPQLPVGVAAEEIGAAIKQQVASERNQDLAVLRQAIERRMPDAPSAVVDQAYQQAVRNIPTVDEITAEINPFQGVEQRVVDQRVMLAATLADEPSSDAAKRTVQRLREVISQDHPEVAIGGVSATQLDTATAASRDIRVVIPLVLVLITVVLMLLLRSIVAPLVLMTLNVLSLTATLGIAALLFNNVWQYPGADPSVVIYGFVFLIALGIDYTIFLMTRVREEVKVRGLRAGTLTALVVTGGVITSAGIVLAATFAALYVIPILFLAQIAFIVSFGVLLDTLVVRSLLAPALTLQIGRRIWWPSALSKQDKSPK